MEIPMMEPVRKGLRKWYFGFLSIILLLLGAVLLFPSHYMSNKPHIFDAPIDYDTRVPNIMNELPHCIHSCLIPRITDLGCAYSDYACFCRNLHLLDDDSCILSTNGGTSFEACTQECDGGDRADLKRSPGLILDLCEALEEPVILPRLMNETLRIYGRQNHTSAVVIVTAASATAFASSATAHETINTTAFSTTAVSTAFDTKPSDMTSSDTTSSATTASATTSSSSITSSTTTSSSSPTNTISSSSGGLSSGAKIGIGVGIALVVVLLALCLGWFIIVYRQKACRAAPAEMQQEKNDGGLPEHISTIEEIAIASKAPPEYSKLAGGTLTRPQEIADTQVYMGRNELPASNNPAVQRYELQESAPSPQRTELGSGPENQRQESSKPGLKSNIQRKEVSPGHSSFPPPWATGQQQGNSKIIEQSQIGQSKEETRNTTTGEMVVEPDENDPELLRLEEEMAKIKSERERLQRLQDLELREEELKRTIGERRKGATGPSSG